MKREGNDCHIDRRQNTRIAVYRNEGKLIYMLVYYSVSAVQHTWFESWPILLLNMHILKRHSADGKQHPNVFCTCTGREVLQLVGLLSLFVWKRVGFDWKMDKNACIVSHTFECIGRQTGSISIFFYILITFIFNHVQMLCLTCI